MRNNQEGVYNPTEGGFYGQFGGAYIPEMLHANVAKLQSVYLDIMAEPSFQEEFDQLLKDYVGRPSPLYLAKKESLQRLELDNMV